MPDATVLFTRKTKDSGRQSLDSPELVARCFPARKRVLSNGVLVKKMDQDSRCGGCITGEQGEIRS